MNSTTNCPICGSTTTSTIHEFQKHLDDHSKHDLIQLLIQQQKQQIFVGGPLSCRKSPCHDDSLPSSSSSTIVQQYSTTSTDYDASLSQDAISQSNPSHGGTTTTTKTYNFNLKHQHHFLRSSSSSLADLQPVAFIDIKDEDEVESQQIDSMNQEGEGGVEYDELVPLVGGTFSNGSSSSTTICDLRPASYQSIDVPGMVDESSCPIFHESEILGGGSHPDNDSSTSCTTIPSSLSEQDSQLKELALPQESDNATSQTSIIKHIINQSDKTNSSTTSSSTKEGLPADKDKQKRWTLPDGRTMPLYTPFTVSKGSLSRIGQETGLATTEKPTNSLNLMTDEEIPPRGEISEFEESNTSSLCISEDSKATLGLPNHPEVAVRLVKKARNIPKPKTTKPTTTTTAAARPKQQKRRGKQLQQRDRNNGGHPFLCYECPVMQTFKSLFELIGHKVKLHPSIADQFLDNNNASSSQPLLLPLPPLPLLSPSLKEDTQLNSNIQPKVAKEFFCVYCNTTFDNKVTLAKHMETDHSDKPLQPNIFECNTCGKTFHARTNLRKHLLVHKERKHICSTCSKGFTSNFKLIEHARVHTKIYPYKCDKCEKEYRTPSLLNHHLKTVHVPESERPPKQKVEFYCGLCHKILRSKRSYICHTKNHHATPKKCAYCCETFSRQSVLVRHIRVSHDPSYESSENKDCPICQKKLHPNSMIKHMRIHANEKNYACSVCSKTFRTYANLSSHSWSHTNIDRPFKCRICPKSYLFKRTLEHHMMVHKRRTLHYVCNECGVRFTNKVNMKRHLEEHYSEKRFKCKICNKAFQRNYYLLEHERIHAGVKPYICTICGKASTTKSNHRAHVKIHDARDATSQEG